jgi:DNA-3-methyladenine glycosylase I
MKHRCTWVTDSKLYKEYHDNEWGVPVYNDETLFEFLVLETFQAGVSWITILNKRENFRKAFDNFNYKKIAKYPESKFNELMQDAGIIRNKLKIRGTITNGKPIVNEFRAIEEVPANTEVSDKLSKDLKKRGFKFTGSTIMYAFMQAVGMVNDHTTDCFRYPNESKK